MTSNLPDAHISKAPQKDQVLSWVGMRNIEIPIKMGELSIAASVDFGVDLVASEARGIHMSRLYALISDHLANQELSFKCLKQVVGLGLQSQNGLSHNCELKISFKLPMLRQALKSGLAGWRVYPVNFKVLQSGAETESWVSTEILYSSTCPASAALAAEINDEPHKLKATPHAQRSRAQVSVQVLDECDIKMLITELESIVGTPVQTAVKRTDEREFALLNAENLMFCEDAARKLRKALSVKYKKGEGRVDHFESLHSHDASASFVF